MKIVIAGLALGVALTATAAPAMQLDKLSGMMGGSGGSLTSGSASNAAGILQYCMTNHYLGGDSGAAGIKDKLLGGASGDAAPAAKQDKGYLDGAKGLLTTGDGKKVNLTGGDSGNSSDMKGQIVHKACDAVLKQGKKLAGM